MTVVCGVCKCSNYNDFCVGFVHFQKMEESQLTPAVLENLLWRPNMLFIPCPFFVDRKSSPLQTNAIMHQMLNSLTCKFVHHPKVTCITNKVTTLNFCLHFLPLKHSLKYYMHNKTPQFSFMACVKVQL